jgi:hypothetical protein
MKSVTEPTPAASLAVIPSADGAHDARLLELWLSLKISPHTRRAYASELDPFRHTYKKKGKGDH